MKEKLSFKPGALERLQATEFEILEVVADFCDSHGIKWFLDSGTALGAVRHKGFIPWDDDIDIGMLRSEYDRFIELATTEGLPDGYQLCAPTLTENYIPVFAKICKQGTKFWTKETIDAGFDQGIFIDVFPYGVVSADEAHRKRQVSRALRYTRMLYLYYSDCADHPVAGFKAPIVHAGFKAAHAILHRTANPKRLHELFEEGIRCPEGTESDESLDFTFAYRAPMKTRFIAETIEAEFEGRCFPIPCDYEGYLTNKFGPTWMELPPESERRTHVPRLVDFGDGVNVIG